MTAPGWSTVLHAVRRDVRLDTRDLGIGTHIPLSEPIRGSSRGRAWTCG